jgi:hypothetical protein
MKVGKGGTQKPQVLKVQYKRCYITLGSSSAKSAQLETVGTLGEFESMPVKAVPFV